jgi:nitroreductase / dihydropteridine reductase
MHTTLTDALAWRYATNEFDTSKEVSATDLEAILNAGNLMPTAYGLQPFRFIVITDKALKEKLVAHSYGQKHVADNSHLVVLAARTDIDEAMISEYTARIEATRNLAAGTTDGFKGMMVGALTGLTPEARLVWAQKQAYIALGGMMAEASLLSVDNHALEGFDPSAYNEVLGLDAQNLSATVLLALGYRSENDANQHYTKVRRTMEDLVVKM